MLYEIEKNKMLPSCVFCFITSCPVLLDILTSIKYSNKCTVFAKGNSKKF